MRIRALLLIVAGGLLVGTAACSSTPDKGTSPPSPTPVATTTHDGGSGAIPSNTDDLSLTASPVLTDGSVGVRKGTTQITVHNNGTFAPALTLRFTGIPEGVQLDGPFWTLCHVSDTGSNIAAECPVDSVPPGGVAYFAVGFANVELGKVQSLGQVMVMPVTGSDPDQSNNHAELPICTNGCSFDMTAAP